MNIKQINSLIIRIESNKKIQDFTEGYYVIIDFASNPDFPMELDRVMKINDSVIRHMITRKE